MHVTMEAAEAIFTMRQEAAEFMMCKVVKKGVAMNFRAGSWWLK